PLWFRATLVMTSIWQTVGWASIIYLAAISGIHPELYEAVVIDGAGRLQQIRYITLPGIVPTITINLILTSGNIINGNFDQVFNLYNDAVMRVADIIDTYVYRVGLVSLDFGYATAVGFFKMAIAFALVMGVNAIARRIGDSGIW
ncbi:MAG TPA: ABC transporter permease subunit, partial [Clostridia bacterium]|nr:ABC transporter permease subunit [Clostridia bacterium]